MTTKEQRDEWARLAEEATPGPWELFERAGVLEVQERDKAPVVHWAGFDAVDRPRERVQVDARFIAAARTAVPALLADLEAAERREEGLRAALRGLPCMFGWKFRGAVVLACDAIQDPPLPEHAWCPACRARATLTDGSTR